MIDPNILPRDLNYAKAVHQIAIAANFDNADLARATGISAHTIRSAFENLYSSRHVFTEPNTRLILECFQIPIEDFVRLARGERCEIHFITTGNPRVGEKVNRRVLIDWNAK